jgi:hypothetical protein
MCRDASEQKSDAGAVVDCSANLVAMRVIGLVLVLLSVLACGGQVSEGESGDPCGDAGEPPCRPPLTCQGTLVGQFCLSHPWR